MKKKMTTGATLHARLNSPMYTLSYGRSDGVPTAVQVWRISYSLYSLRVEFIERDDTSDGNSVLVAQGDARPLITFNDHKFITYVAETNVTTERVAELIKEHLGYDVQVNSMVKK